MNFLTLVTLVALQLTSNSQLVDIFKLNEIEGAVVQHECEVRLESEGYTQARILDDLREYALVCLEYPTSNLPQIGETLEQHFTVVGHTHFSAIGYMSFAEPIRDDSCVRDLVIGSMTNYADEEPLDTMSEKTDVLIIMTRRENLDACS